MERHRVPSDYPFAAIVGLDLLKRAILLPLIEPRLKGALIQSGPGTGKSTLIRGLRRFVAPFLELPINSTEDRLIGGIDFSRTLVAGERKFLSGLLTQADGGLLFANHVNLIDAIIVCHLASALESGRLRTEREGLSKTFPANFLFIGTYDRDEGEPARLLRERVGLLIDAESAGSIEARLEIMNRATQFRDDPGSFIEDYELDTAEMNWTIEEAREWLPRVEITIDEIRQLSEAAVMLGVEGNQADLFALCAARANAAYERRLHLTEKDLIFAIETTLLPRATLIPAPEEQGSDTPADDPEKTVDDGQATDDTSTNNCPSPAGELIIQALDSRLPDDFLPFDQKRNNRAAAGKRSLSRSSNRGRYVRSTEKSDRASCIAVDATIRASAPFQLERAARAGRSASGQNTDNPRLKVTTDDLRYKQFKRKSGLLFIFAVDASGSMAANRMAQAKGALTRLLQSAYLHRDRVALISFRGKRADVLLPPTRSVELAKRLVDAIPSGGATPIAAALARAIDIARVARAQDKAQAMLVLFTDGRANTLFRESAVEAMAERKETINEELKQTGALLAREGIDRVVVDTRSKYTSVGEARALANLIGARYIYLTRPDAASIYEAVSSEAKALRVKQVRGESGG